MAGLRVMLGGLLMVVLAIPALFIFEGMTAVNSVFLSRQTWYDVMSDSSVYDASIDIIRERFPAGAAQREAVLAATPPSYIRAQFNRLVDYCFDILNGGNPPAPTFDVPAPLAAALVQSPDAANLELVSNADGSARLTLPISERSLSQVRGLASQYNMAMVISAVIGLGVWGAAAWLAVDDARRRLLWLGVGLTLASFGVLMLGLAFNSIVTPLLTDSLMQGNADIDSFSRAVLQSLASIVPRTGSVLTLAGGIPLAIGVVLVVIGAIMRPRPLYHVQNQS